MASIPRRALQTGAGRLNEITGVVPTPDHFPAGCAFAARCPQAIAPCRGTPPEVREIAAGHRIACINPAAQDALPEKAIA
jgi:oligopeptide/dipeptide ABC transporter ATP-binding protein